MKAFPTTSPLESWGDPNQGMDLRDYFAIQYVNGVISNFNFDACMTFDEIAKYSYEMADAMMKARVEK